jgi:hypothetical protein
MLGWWYTAAIMRRDPLYFARIKSDFGRGKLHRKGYFGDQYLRYDGDLQELMSFRIPIN